MVPIIAKVLEKLISNQSLNYFETHHLLHDHQVAYHCGRLSDQYSIDKIVLALDQELVVCSAFDHLILVKCLYQLGICDMELKMVL